MKNLIIQILIILTLNKIVKKKMFKVGIRIEFKAMKAIPRTQCKIKVMIKNMVTIVNNIDQNTNINKIIKVGNIMSKKHSFQIARMKKTKTKITTIYIQIETQSAPIIFIQITTPTKNTRVEETAKAIDITNIEIL